MKVLVTGAAGFIGFHVLKSLLKRGNEVVAVDNLLDNRDLDLKRMRLSILGINIDELQRAGKAVSSEGLRFLYADVLDRKRMQLICEEEQFDTIIHLAAISGAHSSKNIPLGFHEVNTTGTINMLEAARKTNVKHFFFSSSAAVYGMASSSPLGEDSDAETPLNMYAASKRAAEMICYAYSSMYKIPVTVFRFFTVYGDWCRRDTIPMAIAHAIEEGEEIVLPNNGELVRDLTYIEDVIDAMDAALATPPYPSANKPAPYQLFNIGRSTPIHFTAYIQTIEQLMGKNAIVKFVPESATTKGERDIMYADTSRLEQILAYSPVWDYTDALPGFVQWFKDNYKVTFTL